MSSHARTHARAHTHTHTHIHLINLSYLQKPHYKPLLLRVEGSKFSCYPPPLAAYIIWTARVKHGPCKASKPMMMAYIRGGGGEGDIKSVILFIMLVAGVLVMAWAVWAYVPATDPFVRFIKWLVLFALGVLAFFVTYRFVQGL